MAAAGGSRRCAGGLFRRHDRRAGRGRAGRCGGGRGYYAMAARAGHAEAGNALAVLLVEGRGLAKDPVEAWAWFALAAERGSGFAAANRDRLGERLSADERAKAEMRLVALRAEGS